MRRQRGLRSPRRSGPHGALEIFRPVGTHSDGESWNRFPLWPDPPCFAGHLCQRAGERRCSRAKDAAGLVRGVVLGIMKPRSHIPLVTYRLQLNRDFTFVQATAIVPYLSALGISHCYVSPCLKARAGSMHGYDIVDHNSMNPEIGRPEDFDRFVSTLHEHSMGLILDIVPNHMGVMGNDNAWWLDVLENGESSPYASFFDIDWHPIKQELYGKVLIPVLRDHYGVVLENGE